jgi:hypothetical protein
MNAEIGNLVYIPSDTNLLQYKKSSPIKVLLTQTPRNLIVLEEEDGKLGVLFEGEVWYVDKKKVYNV